MEQPNILIFMTDQQRADTIPPYARAWTPHLHQFCREGVTFSNAFTVSPHCCPSRATFFSGLYPSQHGVWNNVNVGNALSRGPYAGVRLFSEDLRDAGYETAFSGKWHISDRETPHDRGFCAVGLTTGQGTGQEAGQAPSMQEWRRYDSFQQRTEREEGEIIRQGYPKYVHYGINDNPFNDSAVVSDAVRLLRERSKSGRPWCQFVGTLGPHDPYFVPQRYLDRYKTDELELPPNFADSMTDKPALYRRTKQLFGQLTEREHKEALRHYLAFCTYQDELFGRVLEALEETGEADNTLVLYVSDHGDYAGEHGLWCKGLPCFGGAYRVPAVIRWPKGIRRPGRVEDAYIHLGDFAPTFLDAAGIRAERSFAGRSLLPFLRDEAPSDWRTEHYTQSNGNELYGIQRSVTDRHWKYVYNGFDYDELYDLQHDPQEMRNLINEPRHEATIRRMSRKMWQFAREHGDVCINPYIMVGLAAYGPGVAFAAGEE